MNNGDWKVVDTVSPVAKWLIDGLMERFDTIFYEENAIYDHQTKLSYRRRRGV